ncbi:MAG: hypothetical protein FWC26_05500 [Fibromonadales bacterium]|nr:hypothetical protein [Fibromonadales bacterium]
MRKLPSILLLACGIAIQALVSCSSPSSEEETPKSSSSVAKIPSSSSSSLDCSTISSSSISENLCSDFDPEAEIEHYGKMKKQFCDERDGQKYVYVQISEQIWMAENLKYAICGSKCGAEENYWLKLKDDNSNICDKYGRLYDWHTALTVCPEGWHLPSDEEWEVLKDFAGNSTAGTKLRTVGNDWACEYSEPLSKISVIQSQIIECYDLIEGTDDYGFSALPGSYGISTGRFYNVGEGGFWWSATEYQDYAYFLTMRYYFSGVGKLYDWRTNFLSVRCVKDVL